RPRVGRVLEHAVQHARRRLPPQDAAIEQGTQLQQAMPVGTVPRQARDLVPRNDPDPPQAHVGDQALEALPIVRLFGGPALIIIDDYDPALVPAEFQEPLAKGARCSAGESKRYSEGRFQPSNGQRAAEPPCEAPTGACGRTADGPD